MKLRYLTMIYESKDIDAIRSRDGQLVSESAYMTEYVLREVNKSFSFDCVRINLVCKSDDYQKGKTFFCDSVFMVDVPFSDEYFTYTDHNEKEQYLYSALTEGLKLLCEVKNWDFTVFDNALKSLKENNFKVNFYHKIKQSPDRKTVAKLYCEQTMSEATFYMDFFVKRKLVQRKLCTVTPTAFARYNFRLNQLRWKDEKTVQVINCIGGVFTEVTMD